MIERIPNNELRSKVMTAQEAAQIFKDQMIVGSSGFYPWWRLEGSLESTC